MGSYEFPAVIHWAIPVFLLTLVLEWVWTRRSGAQAIGYSGRDTFCSLALGIGNVLVGLLTVKVYLWALHGVWAYRLWEPGVGLGAIVLCFLLDDFQYYWRHRWGHEIRWLWCAHVTHHSSEHYNLSTALRQPWTKLLTGSLVLSLPAVLIGFHPKLVLFCASLNLLYQYWIHTEAIDKCPRWFEFLFNTPSHHRAHHGNNTRYLDSNYGGTLIVWDRLFGTFVPEDKAQEPVNYGLVTQLESHNPVKAAFHEWISMAKDANQSGIRFSERLRYCVAPPGWSHDGSKLTSAQLKAQAAEAQQEAGTRSETRSETSPGTSPRARA